jgi:predicted enzyme related to lactoylglutathione lyase
VNETAVAAGRIVWFEISAADTASAREFYGDLFGWQFQPFDGQDYHATEGGGGAISGTPNEQGLLAYFGVRDIDTSIGRVRDLGGDAGDKQQVPGIGHYAYCTDRDGNHFGLFQPEAGA